MKQKILFHTKVLLTLLVFHFVLTTFIRFQLGVDFKLSFLDSQIVNLWKDFYLIFIYGLILFYLWKQGKLKAALKNKLVIFFVLLIFLSLLVSFYHFHGLKALFVGFKYDLWFLFPVVFYSLVDWTKKEKENLLKYFLTLVKWTISLSLVFEIIRFTFPPILYLIGYGPVGDWVAGKAPPVLFETGFQGIQRMSGIFSGPNHMAFYFVALGVVIILAVLNKKLHWIWLILYLLLLLGSLSRSALLAFFVEIFLLILFVFVNYKHLRKKILYLGGSLLVLLTLAAGYLFYSGKYHQILIRDASTAGHFKRAEKTLIAIKKEPLFGHGIGTAGPAAHYIKTDIIPESWFLQIFYELGLFVGLLWFGFIFYLIYLLFIKIKITYPYLDLENIFRIGLIIGLVGLLFQGLVLHSFEDSMVSLPLFILVGILISERK